MIAVHYVAWSPDGAPRDDRIVVDRGRPVGGGGARRRQRRAGAVASANGSTVMPALDWSADGRRLAFVMSTRPRGRGLERSPRTSRPPLGSRHARRRRCAGSRCRVRFDPTGASVTYSRIDAEEPTNPWNPLQPSTASPSPPAPTRRSPPTSSWPHRRDRPRRAIRLAHPRRRATTGGSSDNAVIARTVPGGAETTSSTARAVSPSRRGPTTAFAVRGRPRPGVVSGGCTASSSPARPTDVPTCPQRRVRPSGRRPRADHSPARTRRAPPPAGPPVGRGKQRAQHALDAAPRPRASPGRCPSASPRSLPFLLHPHANRHAAQRRVVLELVLVVTDGARSVRVASTRCTSAG